MGLADRRREGLARRSRAAGKTIITLTELENIAGMARSLGATR